MIRYLPLFALLACACGDTSDIGPPPAGGAFGQANVQPECGAFAQACIESGLDAPIAVGAAMGVGIDYDIGGNAGPTTKISATNREVLSIDEAVIFGEAPGASALLILGPDDQVIDFIHLWVAEANELRLVRHNDQGGTVGTVAKEGTLLVGDEILLSVEAFNNTQALLGLFDTEFEIEVLEGDEPIAIVEDIVFGWYRMLARSEGRVRVTATALGLTRELDLEVLP